MILSLTVMLCGCGKIIVEDTSLSIPQTMQGSIELFTGDVANCLLNYNDEKLLTLELNDVEKYIIGHSSVNIGVEDFNIEFNRDDFPKYSPINELYEIVNKFEESIKEASVSKDSINIVANCGEIRAELIFNRKNRELTQINSESFKLFLNTSET